MSLRWEAKNPAEVANYVVNWAVDIGGDTIQTSTFTLAVAAGLVIDSQTHTTNQTTVVLSGGTAGGVATVLNHIVTASGNQFDVDAILEISNGLVVEDGSGKPDCESYSSVSTASAYCAKHGLTWDGTTAKQEAALRRGFDWLNRLLWQSVRVKGRNQAGAWPRSGTIDAEGWPILSTEIPVEIVHANIELAVYELANPGGLTPTVVPANQVRRLREKVGPLETETEYAMTVPGADSAKPMLTRVNALISQFLDTDLGGSGLCGKAERA